MITLLSTGSAGPAKAVVCHLDNADTEALTGGAGMARCSFYEHQRAKSFCDGNCAANWPRFIAAVGATVMEATRRANGKDRQRQWTRAGKTLYLWFVNHATGHVTGDGVSGIWHIARTW
ncbi:hypothetical protein [Paracoccus aestuariivivens]|uniref:hypothetical protein n=1 Tax=Paracoccus aestuariivivens TaxID=1820333 RepID=UPI0014788E03|nr:hypothetical protein [Paracoccus aestuariivivens]